MGQARIKHAAVEAGERNVPLPVFWDELDEDEQKEWVAEQVNALLAEKLHLTVEINED